jgi:outer membrane biosynthesis protein TonB
MSLEHWRQAIALLLSLLMHALLLSLTFGGQGLGLPGIGFPWRDRRVEAPDLRVVFVSTRVAPAESAITSVAGPLRHPSIAAPVAGGPAPTPTPSRSPAPPLGGMAVAIVPAAQPTAEAKTRRNAAAGADPASAPLRADRPGDAAPRPIPEPAVIALERPDEATSVVPAAPSVPTPVIAAAPGTSTPETVMPAPRDGGDAAQERIDAEARERAVELAKLDRSEREAQRQAPGQEAARVEAARQEAERVENARLEAERQEAARLAAAQLEAQRQEVARREAARLEAERQEAARLAAAQQEARRQELARQEAARLEAERQEAARLAAAQQEAQRQEVARREAARLEAQRQEAARLEVARKEAARVQAEQEEHARREARLRAIGRQLDEEAARREAASTAVRSPSTLPLSLSTARRARLWGRTDANVELVQYAEAWARKIQFNTPVDTVRDVAKRPHTNPMVTVAIRSDGSVESVTFVLSSGVAEVDEAIRRIVESQRPYPVFPPALARDFDVIEIRRTWYFDSAVRLY